MNETTRRGFMANAARIGIAAALGGVLLRLIGRGGKTSGDAASPCATCGLVTRCNRPDGVRARKTAGQHIPEGGHMGPPLQERTEEKGNCGESPNGPLVSRWVRREEA